MLGVGIRTAQAAGLMIGGGGGAAAGLIMGAVICSVRIEALIGAFRGSAWPDGAAGAV
ncbi:hypothetical protein ACVGVM_29460 (plasmid) [Pseudonocardia bannensis]|uniref:Uncharacterized protein n=1 Tax=Pseudonocardia bannensis TaxID=630973 RepID=A0A848DPR2_9PSEU|nr:hypothetical protein [Pseudonocardia bannensis]NMH94525.1 hypothetical protein [Pseudonocardia bannensis]